MVCYACGIELERGNRERHHFPIPRRHGGTRTVDLCKPCHNLVDRIPLKQWPDACYIDGMVQMGQYGRLMLLKAHKTIMDLEEERRGIV